VSGRPGTGLGVPAPRYVVHEVEGWAIPDGHQRSSTTNAKAGITACVLDSLVNYRTVKEWRSEDYLGNGRTVEEPRAKARRLAHEHADRLNGAL
jgi:hypothetical protein